MQELLLLIAMAHDGPQPAAQDLFDFSAPGAAWRTIDDVVMGGRSASRWTVEAGVAAFSGNLSLENNGGFASVRSEPHDHELGAFDGLALRLRGDGNRYALRLRTDRGFDGASYSTSFETLAGEWQELRIPFESFRAVFRGRLLPDHPALDPDQIKTLGLMISDRQAGRFRLELDWIRAYRAHDAPPAAPAARD